MKRIAYTLGILMIALAVSGCDVTTGTVPPPPGTPVPQPSNVKKLVMQGCGYVPNVVDIAAVITASPFVPVAGKLAEAICDAATNIPFADGPGDHLPRVNGITIRGYHAKPRLK